MDIHIQIQIKIEIKIQIQISGVCGKAVADSVGMSPIKKSFHYTTTG